MELEIILNFALRGGAIVSESVHEVPLLAPVRNTGGTSKKITSGGALVY